MQKTCKWLHHEMSCIFNAFTAISVKTLLSEGVKGVSYWRCKRCIVKDLNEFIDKCSVNKLCVVRTAENCSMYQKEDAFNLYLQILQI